MAFNVAHILIDAYKGYAYLTPTWWREGLAHYLQREISSDWNNFSQVEETGNRVYRVTDWDVRVRARLKHGLVRQLSELLDNFGYDGITLVDHMAFWSRMEFLIELDKGKVAQFLDRMKGCVDAQGMPLDQKALIARQAAAIDEIWGVDASGLDAQWQDYVRKNYPK